MPDKKIILAYTHCTCQSLIGQQRKAIYLEVIQLLVADLQAASAEGCPYAFISAWRQEGEGKNPENRPD